MWVVRQITSERGGGLFGLAVIVALVSSIAAYAVLTVAMSQARQGRVLHERARVRYAAEAGLVMLRERLWRNPGYCGNSAEQIDTNGDGGGDTTVNLSVSNCAAIRRDMTARVTY